MKLVPLSLFLVLAFSSVACQLNREHSSDSDPEGKEVDSIAYALLMADFEKKFIAIETEYDSASAERQLELEADFEEVDLEMVEVQKQFIRNYPASHQSLKVLNEIDWAFTSASDFRYYLELLDPSLHENSLYQKLDDLIRRMEQVEVGMQAPDFSMEDVDGTSRRLSEQLKSSKYLLLDFWASNCGPCRIENRNIVLAYEMFHDQGFDVLGVSTDTRKEAWLAAIGKDGLIWTNVCSLESWSENEVVEIYALRQTSQNFLLDASGKIIATELRAEDLLATLEELIK